MVSSGDRLRQATKERGLVFITGGTGYIGRPLINALLKKGFSVYALVRPGSERKLPAGARPVIGNALDDASFAGSIPSAATFVHPVGTPHPNPPKRRSFSASIASRLPRPWRPRGARACGISST